MITAFALATLAHGQIQIENIEAGDKVRYPVVLLRGTAKDKDIAVGVSWKKMLQFPVVDGRYTALVELKPGLNMVLLNSGKDILKYRIDYKPMTTPYKVVAVYLTANDETTDYQAPDGANTKQYREKIDTGLKLLQSYCAEAMYQAGFGRKTFALEYDDQGQVVVHVAKHPSSGAELRAKDGNALWDMFSRFLEPTYPFDTNKCCAIMGFTRYDLATQKVTGHTALGGDGLGLFASGSFYTWPSNLGDIWKAFTNATVIDPKVSFDDSGRRGTYWASASTTLGAVMHEMGHTFGLPHSTDPMSIMSRGFDHLNRAIVLTEPPAKGKTEPVKFASNEVAHWDLYSSAWLNWSPWFQPDGNNGAKFSNAQAPTVKLDTHKGEVEFNAPNGIRFIGSRWDNHPAWFQTFSNPAPTNQKFSRQELHDRVGNRTVHISVLDDFGNEASLDDTL